MQNIKKQFEKEGFYAPIDALSASDLADIVHKHEQLQQKIKQYFGK